MPARQCREDRRRPADLIAYIGKQPEGAPGILRALVGIAEKGAKAA
jgi:hypothetical protein